MDSEKTSTKRDTNQLKNDKKQTTIYPHRDEGYFVPIPHPERRYGTTAQPVWRVSFELLSDPSVGVGVDINDEVYLGRSGSSADIIDLKPLGAQERGVSRRHAILRPYANKLFILDNDSTNGTWKNGIDIGKKTPYSLVSGDVITLGHLELVIRIVERPKHSTDLLNKKVDLADALTSLAKTITAQLELDEVLNQTLSMAMELTAAQQAAIWLVDEATSYLDLAASRGIEGTGDMRIRGNNPMVAEVIKSGKAKKTSSDDPDIKVKTGLLVSSVLYVPMTLGGVTFGVLMAANKEEKDSFSERDETLLTAIGDFAAIAVQNARQFEATDRELARRVDELSALNELSLVISTSLDMGVIYDELKHQITRHFEDTVVTLWLADEKLQELINLSDESQRVEIGTGIVGEAAGKSRPYFTREITKNPSYDPKLDNLPNNGGAPAVFTCLPLDVASEVVGVLTLSHPDDDGFTERDMERLQRFAPPIATAVKNARLFAESERERATVRSLARTLHQPLLLLDAQGDVQIANEASNQLLNSHMSQVFEGISTLSGKSGEISVGDQTYIATVESEPATGTIIVMQDITYVKQLEEERMRFVHALSHDLRGPLTSIRGYASLVEARGNLNENQLEYLQAIVRGTTRLSDMIGHLLDIAKLRDDPKENFGPFDLMEAIAMAAEDVKGAAEVRHITIQKKYTGQPYWINGDKRRLHRSVLNLIDNAIKYSPENTTVSVALSFSEEHVRISVKDQGYGIPEEDIPRLFNRFYRGSQETSKLTGAGLGLEMVRLTVQAHDGTIEIKSEVDKGTEFIIILPGKLRVDAP